MSTKRQRHAAAKKASQARKFNILLADGFTRDEIADRRLDARSFKSKEMIKLRSERKEYVAEGEATYINVRDPRERRMVAIAYAIELGDTTKRLERFRRDRLARDGFTADEVNIKRLERIPFGHPVMKLARRMRRNAIMAEMRRMLPPRLRSEARRVFEAQGPLFIRARNIVARQDEAELERRGKDYPYRLLDLVS